MSCLPPNSALMLCLGKQSLPHCVDVRCSPERNRWSLPTKAPVSPLFLLLVLRCYVETSLKPVCRNQHAYRGATKQTYQIRVQHTRLPQLQALTQSLSSSHHLLVYCSTHKSLATLGLSSMLIFTTTTCLKWVCKGRLHLSGISATLLLNGHTAIAKCPSVSQKTPHALFDHMMQAISTVIASYHWWSVHGKSL